MPIHDWTRVPSGIDHDFHNSWINAIYNSLNDDILPPDYYALTEQHAGRYKPVILTQHSRSIAEPAGSKATSRTVIAPKVSYTASIKRDFYVAKRRTIAIRHVGDDAVVALIEILSPGNKDSAHAIRAVLCKAMSLLAHRIHLLLIDLFPPTRRDLDGIHGSLWQELGDRSSISPPGKPLTLASYVADEEQTAHVERLAIHDELIPMPHFLTADDYINVPLEATYMEAYRHFPKRWKAILEEDRP